MSCLINLKTMIQYDTNEHTQKKPITSKNGSIKACTMHSLLVSSIAELHKFKMLLVKRRPIICYRYLKIPKRQ